MPPKAVGSQDRLAYNSHDGFVKSVTSPWSTLSRFPHMAKAGPRKKLPKEIAVINADNCTGCQSCLEVCPVDCIELKSMNLAVKGTQSWCEIDFERCVGCEVCVHIPQKKTNPYELLVCPWDAIEMVPTEKLAAVVAQIGGPPEYIVENWDRLVGSAQHLAEMKAAG
jgi:Na+-translocating ferredoxin:NAD+ oxidoreductase subunit B